MRSVVVSALLIGLCACGHAAMARRGADQQPEHSRRAAIPPELRDGDVIPRSRPGGGATPGFAVPGWSDEQTRRWMDYNNACSSIHCP